MEEDLGTDERRGEVLARTLSRLDARIEELEGCLGDIDSELDLCFEAGKDDIARSLVKRKLETQRHLEAAQRRRRELAQDQAALDERIRDHRSRLQNMRQQAEILAQMDDQHAYDSAGPESGHEASFSVSDEDVEVALLRERRRRERS